jgi:hypothetical protein
MGWIGGWFRNWFGEQPFGIFGESALEYANRLKHAKPVEHAKQRLQLLQFESRQFSFVRHAATWFGILRQPRIVQFQFQSRIFATTFIQPATTAAFIQPTLAVAFFAWTIWTIITAEKLFTTARILWLLRPIAFLFCTEPFLFRAKPSFRRSCSARRRIITRWRWWRRFAWWRWQQQPRRRFTRSAVDLVALQNHPIS